MVDFLFALVIILILIIILLAISLKKDYTPVLDPTLEKIKNFLDNAYIGYDSNCTHSPSEAIDHISNLINGKSYHANSSNFDSDNTVDY